MGNAKHVFLRAIVYKDVSMDLIIVLPSIKYFDLLPILHSHISTKPCCEICEVLGSVFKAISPVAHFLTTDELSSDRHPFLVMEKQLPLTTKLTPPTLTSTDSRPLSYRHGQLILPY